MAGGSPTTPIQRKASGLHACFSPTPLSRATSASAAALGAQIVKASSSEGIQEPRASLFVASDMPGFAGQILGDTATVSPSHPTSNMRIYMPAALGTAGAEGGEGLASAGSSTSRSYGLLKDPRFEEAAQQGNWAAFLSDASLAVRGGGSGSLSRSASTVASTVGGASPPHSMSGAHLNLQQSLRGSLSTSGTQVAAQHVVAQESSHRRGGAGSNNNLYGLASHLGSLPCCVVWVGCRGHSPQHSCCGLTDT
jgi:hypothetical protein